MEEKKEFEIINQDKYVDLKKTGKILSKSIPILSILAIGTAVCIDGAISMMLSSNALPATIEKILVALAAVTNTVCGISVVKSICGAHKIREALSEIDYCYDNADDKENIEVPTDAYNRILGKKNSI